MKKILLLTAIVFSFVACDPIYHLNYAVMNETDQPIYCVDKSKSGVGKVVRVEPDSFIQVYFEAGIGWAKPQFRESKPEITKRFVLYTDSTLSDSTQITPRKGWKYYRLPIGGYNARLYIRRSDLRRSENHD